MSQSTPDDQSPIADSTPTTPSAPASPAPATAAPRKPLPRWVPITSLAVGGALLLGLVFSGGVAVGRILPDRGGPAGYAVGGGHGFGDRGDRGGQDMRGDRGPMGGDGLTQEQREQFRDEMIDRWQELQRENG